MKPRAARRYRPVALRQLRGEQVEPAGGEPDADDRGADGEQHALDQQLTHDRPAPGADGAAHGELLLPRVRACHQEVRRVDARDEEHERHRAKKNQERLPRVTHDLIAQERCGETLTRTAFPPDLAVGRPFQSRHALAQEIET